MSTLLIEPEAKQAGADEKGWGKKTYSLQACYSVHFVHIKPLNVPLTIVLEAIVTILILQMKLLPREVPLSRSHRCSIW